MIKQTESHFHVSLNNNAKLLHFMQQGTLCYRLWLGKIRLSFLLLRRKKPKEKSELAVVEASDLIVFSITDPFVQK